VTGRATWRGTNPWRTPILRRPLRGTKSTDRNSSPDVDAVESFAGVDDTIATSGRSDGVER
jgi:hypothetical protein